MQDILKMSVVTRLRLLQEPELWLPENSCLRIADMSRMMVKQTVQYFNRYNFTLAKFG
jgi:NADH:ubiquinone oxidoreductase subunit E